MLPLACKFGVVLPKAVFQGVEINKASFYCSALKTVGRYSIERTILSVLLNFLSCLLGEMLLCSKQA